MALCFVAGAAGLASAADAPGPRAARPVLVSRPGDDVESYELAGNARGDVALVWRTFAPRGHYRLWFRDRPAGGSFSRIRELSNPRADPVSSSVALAPDGTEFVIWSQINNRVPRRNGVLLAVRHPAGRFGTPHRLSRHFYAFPYLAVGPGGTAIAAWSAETGHTSQIRAVLRAPNGRWSRPQVVSHGKRLVSDPTLALDGAGNATLVWQRWPPHEIERDGPALGREQYQVRAAFRPAGGRFGAPQLLSDPRHDAYGAYLAVGARGDVAVFWGSESPNFDRDRVGFTTRAWDGGFGDPQWLTQPGKSEAAAGAIDPTGNLTAVWSAWKPCGHRPLRCRHVLTARRPFAGQFGAARSIGGSDLDPWEIAVDTTGNTFVVGTSRGTKRNGFRVRVEGRFLSADGTLEPYRHFSRVGDNTDEAAVLADNGVATIAWMHLVKPYTLHAHNRLKMLRTRVRP